MSASRSTGAGSAAHRRCWPAWSDEWKELLGEAGVREARLHDARHTAATVLLILGVLDRTAMDIMGWSSPSMKKRYMHVTDDIRRDVAGMINEYFWKIG